MADQEEVELRDLEMEGGTTAGGDDYVAGLLKEVSKKVEAYNPEEEDIDAEAAF